MHGVVFYVGVFIFGMIFVLLGLAWIIYLFKILGKFIAGCSYLFDVCVEGRKSK